MKPDRGPFAPGRLPGADPLEAHQDSIISLSVAASLHLPFVPAVLYDEDDPTAPEPPDGDVDKVRLSRNFGPDKETRPNMADSVESLFAQYFALCVYPTARYVCSSWHAGMGQVSFGSNRRRRADLLVSVPEDPTPAAAAAAAARAAEGSSISSSSSGGCNKTRTVLRFLNMDGLRYHDDGEHQPDCPKATEQHGGDGNDVDAEAAAAAAKRDRQLYGDPTFGAMATAAHGQGGGSGGDVGEEHLLRDIYLQQKRKVFDDQYQLKVDYAAALSAVDPEHLVVTYDRVHECQMMHQGRPPDPSKWNAGTSGGDKRIKDKHDSWHKYKSVREYLVAQFPEESVLGLKDKSFTQKQLVDKIMQGGYNSEGNEFGGFVCITGGRETRTDDDMLSQSFGFCHQRVGLSEDEIGGFTKYQALLQNPGAEPREVLEALKKLAAQPRTIVKTSFNELGEVLPLDYLRFLIKERGLKGFRIKHFLFYREKTFLTPYIRGLIQLRHDLRFQPGHSKLYSMLLKGNDNEA